MASLLRRALFPLRLARARLASRGGRIALVGLGIAVGAAMLAGVLGGSLVARDRSLARATAQLPAADRAVRAVWDGIPGQNPRGWPALDRAVVRAVAPLAHRRSPVRVELVRETELGGTLVDLGAVDGLGRFVRLESGRLPRECRPARCEVLQLGGSGRIPSVPGLRLVRVGRAELASDLPLGNLISREAKQSILSQALAYHTPAAPPFLLADGVRALAAAAPLVDTYRSYSWVLPVRPGDVHPWSLDAFADEVTRARSRLVDADGLFDVTAPTDELVAARASTDAAGGRLLLVGGEAAALLLAFTLLAASSLRRDVRAARRRLVWHGARRWQLAVFAAAEAGAIAVAAAVAGWALGAGAAAVVAARAGSPSGAVLSHSVVSAAGIGIGLALAGAAAAVLLGALLERSSSGRGFGALDAAALGALGAIVLALVRGDADAQSLSAGNGTGALLLLLPGLIAFVAAVAAARLLAPALRRLDRAVRRAPVPLRLATLSLARDPGRAAIAVAFLVVSLGFALFAAAYRTTLQRGQTEQAAYAVPADYVLTEDLAKLVPVTEIRPPHGAVRVLRLSGDVSRLGGSSFTLLGLPARRLPDVGGWRSDFSALSLRTLAARLTPALPRALRGVRLPARADTLVLPARVHGDAFTVDASLETPAGAFVDVSLGVAGRGRALRGAIPLAARGGRIVSLAFGPTGTGLHAAPNGGTGIQPLARGTALLGPFRTLPNNSVLQGGGATWTGTAGVAVLASRAGSFRLRYVVTPDGDSRLRVRQPTDGIAVPVAATPALARAAGPGGLLPLAISGEQVRARVVAVVRRFPSIDGEAVVADRDTIATALNAAGPGTGVVDELWLNAPPSLARSLSRTPYDALAVASRRALAHDLKAEPLARGILIALAAAALAALALALAGLQLALVSDARDESGELFDLEAQGAEPSSLRRHLRLRAALVTAVGLAGGVGVGAILSALVVAFVTLTANATTAEPPLRLALDWPVLAFAFAAYAATAAVLVTLTTLGALRGRVPARFAEGAAA